MKLKLNDIFYSYNSLLEISQLQLPVKGAYKIARIIRKISPDFETIEKQRLELVNKYGEKNDKGITNVTSENMTQFMNEFNELLSTEVDIDVEPITQDLLGDIKVQPQTLLSLNKFLD